MNISVEFEYEKDPPKKWLRRGGYKDFSKKILFSELFTTYKNRYNFYADSESDISFEPNRSFLTKHRLKKVLKCIKTASRNRIA